MDPLKLAGSALGKHVLLYLFYRREDLVYLRELAAFIKTDPSNLSKFVRKAERTGILHTEKRGNLLFIRLNKQHPAYHDIRSLLEKTSGIVPLLKEAVGHIPGISRAYLFGSSADGTLQADSDIDVLLVGDTKETEVMEAIHPVENTIGREINYIRMSEKEIISRKRSDSFVRGIFSKPHISLL